MKIGTWDSDSGKVFVIAEAGINHNGSFKLAADLVIAAALAGANAVKFQWFNTDALVARRGPAMEALRPYQFGVQEFLELKAMAEGVGLTFLCSVFDLASADAYLALHPAAVKIGSGELREQALIAHVAQSRLPMILSTGMATLEDVRAVVRTRYQESYVWTRLALLHCVSAYPTPLEQVNLRAMDALQEFRCPVGFSDHTLGTFAASVAVARGACIIEKHLTMDTRAEGPDHAASADPTQFKRLVEVIRHTTLTLGSGEKVPQACEAETMKACGL